MRRTGEDRRDRRDGGGGAAVRARACARAAEMSLRRFGRGGQRQEDDRRRQEGREAPRREAACDVVRVGVGGVVVVRAGYDGVVGEQGAGAHQAEEQPQPQPRSVPGDGGTDATRPAFAVRFLLAAALDGHGPQLPPRGRGAGRAVAVAANGTGGSVIDHGSCIHIPIAIHPSAGWDTLRLGLQSRPVPMFK